MSEVEGPGDKAQYFGELFCSPANRARATAELGALGEDALPIIQALLSGRATNPFGVSYSKLGVPIDCALVAAGRLGGAIKILEPDIRQWIRAKHPYAPSALGNISELNDDTIISLASCLPEGSILAYEAAAALWRAGASTHPAVEMVTANSEQARKVMCKVAERK